MSSSNANNAPSQKRPLEDPSSDSAPGDQPDAKRPALEGGVNQNGDNTDATLSPSINANANGNGNGATVTAANTGGGSASAAAAAAGGETTTPASMPAASTVLETQPIQSTASMTYPPDTTDATSGADQDESSWIHMRALLTNNEAATIIGRNGDNVSTIRRLAGAKCTISAYTRGAIERVLTISGLADGVAKAFGLVVRTLNGEALEEKSTAQSKTYPMRLLVPHLLVGAVIGQRGTRIREIQDYSGARLTVSDACLPLSSERSMVVLGVADAVHIATYYIGTTLVNQLTEKYGGPAASGYATRNGGQSGYVPGGLQVMPYVPQPVGGRWGHPDTYNARNAQAARPPPTSYGAPQAAYPPTTQAGAYAAGMSYGNRSGYTGAGPATPQSAHFGQPFVPPQPAAATMAPQGGAFPGQPLTQQIYIPNDMVGAIIGKGGAKINEIRVMSGSTIKINEPTDNSNERLVTISGTNEQNQMALYMLYQRLGELSWYLEPSHDSQVFQSLRSTASEPVFHQMQNDVQGVNGALDLIQYAIDTLLRYNDSFDWATLQVE